jgi:hypothetical protein
MLSAVTMPNAMPSAVPTRRHHALHHEDLHDGAGRAQRPQDRDVGLLVGDRDHQVETMLIAATR